MSTRSIFAQRTHMCFSSPPHPFPFSIPSCVISYYILPFHSRYYNQDDNAGRLMTQTLTHLPPSQRAPFSRLQASIRSAYHANVNARRTAEFQAHLAAMQPGGSLMPHSRSNPRGPSARKVGVMSHFTSNRATTHQKHSNQTQERFERFERFIRSWCTMGMPGTKPFFEALWAVMRLQVVPENFGGAGGYRIQWEIDDAVFKEAA